jgi:hypothetical protein
MHGSVPADRADALTLRCPRCDSRMDRRILPVLHQRVVEVDHCGGCRLVWFDAFESVALTGVGWVMLIRLLQDGAGLALPPAKPTTPGCPRCAAPLKAVHNRSRYGQFVMLECPQRHGHLHSHSGVLAERGFVRGLLPAERSAWSSREHPLNCLNCGGPTRGESDRCRFCDSPLVVVDLPRLLHGLRHASQAQDAAPRLEGQPFAWSCVACGAAMDPNRDTACGACGQPAIAPSLDDLNPLLDQAEARWLDADTRHRLAAAQRRPQEVVRERRRGDHRETQLHRTIQWWRRDDAAIERAQALGLPDWLALAWRWSGVIGGLLILLALWWW